MPLLFSFISASSSLIHFCLFFVHTFLPLLLSFISSSSSLIHSIFGLSFLTLCSSPLFSSIFLPLLLSSIPSLLFPFFLSSHLSNFLLHFFPFFLASFLLCSFLSYSLLISQISFFISTSSSFIHSFLPLSLLFTLRSSVPFPF